MLVVPVAELVREDGLDFVGLALLHEGVEDDDVFAPGETEEVGVAVRAALAAIDFVEMHEGEVEPRGQLLRTRAEVALWERGKLVKERLDEGGVYDDHRHLKGDPVAHNEHREQRIDEGIRT